MCIMTLATTRIYLPYFLSVLVYRLAVTTVNDYNVYGYPNDAIEKQVSVPAEKDTIFILLELDKTHTMPGRMIFSHMYTFGTTYSMRILTSVRLTLHHSVQIACKTRWRFCPLGIASPALSK